MYSLLAFAALAIATEPAEPPALNSQRFRPSIDAERFVWADDATVGERGRLTARSLLSLTENPMVYRYDDGHVEPVVAHLVQMNLLFGYAVGPVRVGFDAPVYLRSFGGSTEDVTEMGDVAIDLKGRILDRTSAPVGLAVSGRLGLPTSLAPALANDSFTGELTVIADRDVGDVRFAGALGSAFVPDVLMENLVWGPQILFRVGAGYAFGERAGVGVDLNGNSPFAEGDPTVSFPVEAMLSGWLGFRSGLVLRAGVGSGVNAGFGSPSFRGVLGIGYEPEPRRDSDGDQIWDDDDKCPADAEDGDEYQDTDGCPELTRVKLSFVDKETKQPVREVSSGVAGREGRGDRELDLASDSYALQATAPGYATVRMMIEVPPGKPMSRVVAMQREASQGRLLLKVVDEAGRPVEATVALPGLTLDRPTASLDRSVMAGELGAVVSAPGYATRRQTIALQANETLAVTVTLRVARVTLGAARLELFEPVRFVPGRDLVLPESFAILDEVVDVLLDHPELAYVQVAGHTDTTGGDADNLDLSERMAASVRQYLVDKGVAPGRLGAKGFGESKGLKAPAIEFIVNAPRER
ncbi:hypothetical protein LBMAG42_17150 [Deltaproteobacteria bacterium]|nr:hypothetical protein LBMAG42_17150 [Deltaproteobacteria bacterium]